MPTLEDAIHVIRTGDREKGREILEEILEVDESNEDVWLWLSSVVDTDEDREICLENVLALNPDNIVAQRGLEALRTGTFNVYDIVSETDEEEETEEAAPTPSETTFLEEFMLADDSDIEEELEYPSTMKPPQREARKGGFPIRLILLAVFVVCVVLALGGAAAMTYFSGGEGGTKPSQDQPTQQTPAEGDQPEATPTEALEPTDTPVPPTDTPLELPTKKPTQRPTPTSTPVVSPTARKGA